jgi:hypothetical protein
MTLIHCSLGVKLQPLRAFTPQRFSMLGIFLMNLTGLQANLDSRYVFLSRQASYIYEKLFYGNNLPSITPIGEHYIPSWSNDELIEMRLVFMAGLDHLKKKLEPR